jgi:hypothetical protein
MVIDRISVKNFVFAKKEVFNIINISEKRKISMKNLLYLIPYGYFVIDSW